MIALASILMLAAATRVELVNEVYRIPANEWRYVELGLNQRAAQVSAWYQVQGHAGPVRLALMRRDDLEHLRAGLPHGVIDETEPGASGALAPQVRGPGDFVLVIDNREDAPAEVRLRVTLDFAARAGPEVTGVPRNRQLTVILISFGVFFAIVTWSARRLLKGMQR